MKLTVITEADCALVEEGPNHDQIISLLEPNSSPVVFPDLVLSYQKKIQPYNRTQE